jgi:hypothetical protein
MGTVGTAPGTTTLTLPGGFSIALSDWIDDRHWTTIELQNGDSDTLTAFASGRSQPIVGGTRASTLVDTNIPSTGLNGLPKDWEFLVYGLAAEIMRVTRANAGETNPRLSSYSDPVNLRTFFEINRRIAMSYVFNGKSYSTGLIFDYPAGHGFQLFTTQPAVELANNGVPSPRDRVAMVLPIHERELLGYSWEVNPVIPLIIDQPAADEDEGRLNFVDLRLIKNGLIKRTVV